MKRIGNSINLLLFANSLLISGIFLHLNKLSLYPIFDTFFLSIIGYSLSGRSEAIQVFVLFLFAIVLSIPLYLIVKQIDQWMDFDRSKIPSIIVSFFTLISPIPLFLISLKMRPVIDDFIFLGEILHKPLISVIKEQYFTWSGRYMTYPVSYLSHMIPYKQFVMALPVIVFVLTSAGLSILIHLLLQGMIRRQGRYSAFYSVAVSLVMGIALTIGIYLISPSIFSSIYWFAGGVVYGIGLVFSILSFAFLFKSMQSSAHRKIWYFLALISVIIACGSNELTALSMVILSFCALINSVIFHYAKSYPKILVILFFLTAVFFCGISLIAPGNFVRANFFTGGDTGNFTELIIKRVFPGMNEIFGSLVKRLLEKTTILLSISLIFLFIGFQIRLSSAALKINGLAGLGCLLAAYGCFLTNGAIGWAPERTMIIPTVWILVAIALLSLSVGSFINNRRSMNLSFVSLLLITGLLMWLTIDFYEINIDKVTMFSAETDFREAMISEKQKTGDEITVCKVTLLFDDLEDLREDPSFYVNTAMARFYELKEIRATENCSDLMK